VVGPGLDDRDDEERIEPGEVAVEPVAHEQLRADEECGGQSGVLVVRIVMLSRLTAATSWQWIPVPLLASGVYQGILQSAGIEFTAPCRAEVDGVNVAGRPG
jgi:hypothetical protein